MLLWFQVFYNDLYAHSDSLFTPPLVFILKKVLCWHLTLLIKQQVFKIPVSRSRAHATAGYEKTPL
jgi:hypothetical protein